MAYQTGQRVNEYMKRHRRRSTWKKMLSVLGVMVVFCTTYALILPAITEEYTAYCGVEEHIHSVEEGCYEPVLTCALEEGHIHSDACYQTQQALICHQVEESGHIHSDACYDEEGNLICGMEEGEGGHVHSDACYDTQSILICGQEEGHVHSDACYEETLTCTRMVHTHTLACFSNPGADVEEGETWKAKAAEVELTGYYNEDLVAVAATQVGYQESTENYIVMEDGETIKGYTVYGAYCGMPYEDWCAMFVSFCLNYAEVPTELFPRASSCSDWAEQLQGLDGYWASQEEWRAAYDPGSLVFFDNDGDELADHVGIVSDYELDEVDMDSADDRPPVIQITVIEGNSGDAVEENIYALPGETILGFAYLPYEDGGAPAETAVVMEDGEGNLQVESLFSATTISEDATYVIQGSKGAMTSEVTKSLTGVTTGVSCTANDDLIWHFTASGDGWKIHYIENETNRQYLEMTVYTNAQGNNSETNANLTFTDDVNSASVFTVETSDTYPNNIALRTTVTVNGTSIPMYINNYSNAGFAGWYKGALGDGNNRLTLYKMQVREIEVEKNTVSPSSTLIDVFDYWINDAGNMTPDGNDANEAGINQGKTLKFRSNNINSAPLWNYYESGYGARQGIVKNVLGSDGYPVLDLADKVESLNYLFDPKLTTSEDSVVAARKTVTNAQGLLQQSEDGYFYYNCMTNYACLKKDETGEYTNEFVVYKEPYVDADGQFFPFNSLKESLENEVSSHTDMNHYFGVSITTRFIQQHGGHVSADRSSSPITFHFAGDDDVWIFIDNVLVGDLGGIHGKVSVDIDFASGKVTVDPAAKQTYTTTLYNQFVAAGKVAELSTGDPPPTGWQYTTDSEGQHITFADNTTHTLKFFYLERGSGLSNMELKYNLAEIPATSVYKVNQYGEALEGATFAVYAAAVEGEEETGTWYYQDVDGTNVIIPQNVSDDAVRYDETTWDMTYDGHTFQALYYGKTDSRGEMVFLDRDNMYYSLSELEQMFGTHFILREVDLPEGYRTVSDDTYLYIKGGLLQTADPYGTGVWASPNALITATSTLYVAGTSEAVAQTLMDTNNENYSPYVQQDASTGRYTIDYYSPTSGAKGTLFTVVLKRNEQDKDATTLNDLNLSTWYPVSGSEDEGYQVMDDTTFTLTETNRAAAIKAARINVDAGQTVTFSVAASGMQLLLENLPGKPERYYSYVYNNNKTVDSSEPQYVVAYYWTTAEKLADANENNTVRVASHENTTPGADTGFDVQWGSTIQVPNVLNRLFFQKRNEAGELVNNAVFALYNVEEHKGEKYASEYDYIYYIGDADINGGTKYWVTLLDSDGSAANAGKAAVFQDVSADGSGTSATLVGYGIYSINTEGWTPETGSEHAGRVLGENIGRIKVTVTDADANGTKLEAPVTVYVDPAMDVRGYPLVGYTHKTCDVVSEDGTGHLSYLDAGRYYLREIAAPVGYAINTSSVPVYIDSTGVYANAGTSNNRVAVGNGVGYLVATMNTFASQGDIDESLTWVYGALIVNQAEDFSAFADDTGDTLTVSGTNWNFAVQTDADEFGSGHASGSTTSNSSEDRAKAMVTYLVYTGDDPTSTEDIFDYSPNDNQNARIQELYTEFGKAGVETLAGQKQLRLYTTTGWSDLAIYQDYAYGNIQATTNAITNYDDLTDKGNLANLFSSSTFVEVTDLGWVDLELIKTESGTNQVLTGAEFRLKNVSGEYYHRDGNETTWVNDAEQATVISPGDAEKPGIFYDLPIETYTLEEIKAPDGYHLLTETIRITVRDPAATSGVTMDAEGTGAVLSDAVTMVDENHTIVTDGSTTGQGLHYQYTLTVPNSSGYTLPETGGSGTRALILLGMSLTAIGCCGLVWRRKRGGAA